MAIVTFWSDSRKDTAQTSSALAVATYVSMEKNMRVLLIDANFDDDGITRAYWRPQKENKFLKELNKGKVDISAGADGLVSAISSNKVTPEIISNFTKAVFKNRLDILPGLTTKAMEEFDSSLQYYNELLLNANKFYDLVFVDLQKTATKPAVKTILDTSSIIMYTLTGNPKMMDEYVNAVKSYNFLQKNNVIPLLGRSDDFSKYNHKNVAKKIGEKGGMAYIPYNLRYSESTYEGDIAPFFINISKGRKDYETQDFVNGLNDAIDRILFKVQELQIR